MIKCECVKILLSKYVDNEADAMESNIVDEHVRECSWCSKDMEELVRFKKILAGKQRKSLPSEYLVCRLRERIGEGVAAGLSLTGLGDLSRKLMPVPAIMIAVAVIALVGWPAAWQGKGSLREQTVVSASLATRQAAWNLLLEARVN